MSANQYVNSVPIFQGDQGKYYIVDGFKYDIHFPLAQALDHKMYTNHPNLGSGPKACENCASYGSVNGVFVGYCVNCLYGVYNQKGSHILCPELDEKQMWEQYPYMNGVRASEIGDTQFNMYFDEYADEDLDDSLSEDEVDELEEAKDELEESNYYDEQEKIAKAIADEEYYNDTGTYVEKWI
jgi:hypothetical protein